MDAENPDADDAQSPTQLVEINRVCDRFEAAWRAGRRPSAEDHLGDADEPGRTALLREVLAIEIESRKSVGERPDFAEYRARFPEHAAVIEAVFDKAGLASAAPSAGAVNHARNLLFGL